MTGKIVAISVILLVTLVGSMAAAQNVAPFCVVSQTGQQNCFYYNLDACRQAARTLNGACAANPSASQQQTGVLPVHEMIEQPDIAGSVQRGYAEGQRQRIERERHQAEMELLKAQTEMVTSGKRQGSSVSLRVIYRCPDDQGVLHLSDLPSPGCIVDSVVGDPVE